MHNKGTTKEGDIETNTPMQEVDGDSKMTPSEVGTKDLDLRDIMEREGIVLLNILEQWKKQGFDNIPTDQLDHIQYLLLWREEAKTRGTKRMHAEIGNLGIKIGDGQPQHSPKQTRRKKGRKSNNATLDELGALMINSSKIKNIFPNSPPHTFKMKVITWNISGPNIPRKQRNLKNRLNMEQPDICFILNVWGGVGKNIFDLT